MTRGYIGPVADRSNGREKPALLTTAAAWTALNWKRLMPPQSVSTASCACCSAACSAPASSSVRSPASSEVSTGIVAPDTLWPAVITSPGPAP